MRMKLAQALLRRKELQQKVDLLKVIDAKALYENRVKRVPVTDNVDQVIADVPKLTAAEVTREHDFHARQLREVDAAIQQANWNTEIEVDDIIGRDFVKPE